VATNDRLLVLARRQHGVFTLKQAVDIGCARSTIARMLERRVWEEVAPRVYRAAVARPLDWKQATMAAVLGSRAVAAGRSAGALLNLLPPPPMPELLALRGPRHSVPAIVRTTSSLPASDLTTIDGIPSTNPVRTIIDLGGLLPLPAFEDVLDTAIVGGLVRQHRVAARAEELSTPRRRGCSVVLSLLAERRPDLARAANVWEARVAQLVRKLGMPDPELNHPVIVGGRRRYLDLAWPDAKVAVEFDGFVPHSTRRVFDDDRSRQNDMVADGWSVFRVTKTMLDADPEGTFRPIAAELARNSPHVVKSACH
jgi:very-short-patch-repair endonuclease